MCQFSGTLSQVAGYEPGSAHAEPLYVFDQDGRFCVIDFDMTPEQEDLREMTAALARDRYAPLVAEWDESSTFFPREERSYLASLGLMGMCLPEEHGGDGAQLIDALIVVEELAKECQLAAFYVFEANTGPARVVDLFGTEDQKARLLPPIIAGEKVMAVAISEPDAGSAATDMTTQARLEGDEFVVNGMKRWSSGGGHAEQYLVYCRLDDSPGSGAIGALVVDDGTPGLTYGKQEQFMGFHGIPSADMFLDDVRVPAENLLVGAGGFRQLFTAFSIERLGNATMSLAIGQACLDRTARYVQERQQFGKDIIDFQAVQLTLADMILQVEAARLLIYRAATHAGRGAPVTVEASIAKCYANEMAKRVSDMAIQLHGANGYSREYGIERYHRDAHGWALGGGTPNIQRTRIVSEYLGRGFNQRR
jgi:alkylation response protein AidB-like acyl-CoA dehydrogenase